ncbi:MAG TPA: M67 family metallopeptidase [Anaerolineae bacterium]|nr:M67 family metallopeptidase [Anaerolineae bacterium]
MLILTAEILAQIQADGVASYPYEGCGLLLGEMVGEENVVKGILSVPNRWPVEEEKRERFLIVPEDMLAAEFKAMEAGWDIIGVYHSHPDCAPVASPRDVEWAAWVGYSYLITEVGEGVAKASRSWQLLPSRDGFVEEEVVVRGVEEVAGELRK